MIMLYGKLQNKISKKDLMEILRECLPKVQKKIHMIPSASDRRVKLRARSWLLVTCRLLMVAVVMLSPAPRSNFLKEKMVANVAASQIRFGPGWRGAEVVRLSLFSRGSFWQSLSATVVVTLEIWEPKVVGAYSSF